MRVFFLYDLTMSQDDIIISLVQTCQDRKDELIRFVHSLNAQQGIDLSTVQLIFYDQGQNKEVFEKLNPQIRFSYLKGERASLSKARNICLPFVEGKYVAFPDDDCWYEPNTLSLVLKYLQEGRYQGVTGKGTNEKGELTNKFPQESAELTPTKRCAAISYTIFAQYNADVQFDENMGVGSPFNFGAGEETDYILSLMENYGYKFFYTPDISVHHPTSKIYNWEQNCKRAYSYARGDGYLSHKHNFPLIYILRQLFRPLGGIMVYFLKGDYKKCRRSYLIFKGRTEGLFSNIVNSK